VERGDPGYRQAGALPGTDDVLAEHQHQLLGNSTTSGMRPGRNEPFLRGVGTPKSTWAHEFAGLTQRLGAAPGRAKSTHPYASVFAPS
jgi:hypothetical protein